MKKKEKSEEPRYGWSADEWPETPLEPLYRPPKRRRRKIETDRLKRLGWLDEKGNIS